MDKGAISPEKLSLKCIYCGHEFELDKEKFSTGCFCQSCGKRLNIENDKVIGDTDPEKARLLDEYNNAVKRWRKRSIIISVMMAVFSVIAWLTIVVIEKDSLFVEAVRISSTVLSIGLFVFGPIIIGDSMPNGSKIPDAGIRRPNHISEAAKYYVFFVLLEIVAMMFAMLILCFIP